ncbi:TetR/AcrR family transcriptional regulator [Umezawaea sp. Da 62-37]|uniref:TetR/AcrR family transcriptional regulator n=1 Tax=Umezawaea sp. Da 62-37 TaxID=3075927 RepID=UPI0028F7482F|nr:TetR/AcrR family transcriptional regulator [Umezawaea sp. Da 62-37]WNV82998.1 TetR/AcrR family transcriptional regulator [Umezawaea sp. Da 62-37]
MRNHERILAAARDAIEMSGASVRLDDVARRAGVGMATIYRRFAGRQELVQAVFEQFFTVEIEPIVQAARADPDPWRGLVSGLEGTVASIIDNRVLLEAVWDAGVAMTDVAGRFLEPLSGVLQRAQAAGTVRPDLRPEDLPGLVTMVVAPVTTGQAAHQWRRFLHVMLDGVRMGGPLESLPD